VLLVEDEGSIRELVGSMLRKVGYTVLEASDGEEALELAKNHEGAIHLVLTDVVMPGIDGCVLAERLTAVRTGTRVLYMSGYACDLKLRVDKDAGHFLQKPFSRQTLVTKVCEVLTVDEGVALVGVTRWRTRTAAGSPPSSADPKVRRLVDPRLQSPRRP
jgi:two-component system cell cycle sensor histidine kinase/response regulator CckA